MTPIADKLAKGLDTFIQTTLSVVKIILFSRRTRKTNFNFKNNKELVILGNGPSLKTTLEYSSDFLSDKTLLAVNFSVISPSFEELQPQMYVVADPFFWTLPSSTEKLFGTLAQKTKWPLNLYIPTQAFKNATWIKLIEDNKNIIVRRYNATPIEASTKIAHLIFKKGLGVPRPHNVLIPSLILGLNSTFEKIYIAGADHSWLKDITISDNNEMLMNQKHYYDDKQTSSQQVSKRDHSSAHLHDALFHMYTAFKSYFVIKKYASYLNKEIFNITPESYIDAFVRLKTTKNG